jgi:hypothetical protein
VCLYNYSAAVRKLARIVEEWDPSARTAESLRIADGMVDESIRLNLEEFWVDQYRQVFEELRTVNRAAEDPVVVLQVAGPQVVERWGVEPPVVEPPVVEPPVVEPPVVEPPVVEAVPAAPVPLRSLLSNVRDQAKQLAEPPKSVRGRLRSPAL